MLVVLDVVVPPPGVVVPGVLVVVDPDPMGSPKILVKRLAEGRLHDHLVARSHDHPGQLGDGALLGLQVERLEVHDRVLDGDHQQVAADHLAAGLVPQRELRRDQRVVGDARLDLGRARRPACPWGSRARAACRSCPRPAGPPAGGHVLLAQRSERLQQRELRLGLRRAGPAPRSRAATGISSWP